VKRTLLTLVALLWAAPASAQFVASGASVPSVTVGCVWQVQSLDPVVTICGGAGSGDVTKTGTRTAGTLTKWSSDGVITNSIITESGSVASVATMNVTTAFTINGVSLNTTGTLGNVVYVSTAPALTGTNFTGIPAASILPGTFGSGNYAASGQFSGNSFRATGGYVTDAANQCHLAGATNGGYVLCQGPNATTVGQFTAYITESDGGSLTTALLAYSTALEIGSTLDFIVHATKRLYIDGGGDTYIVEGGANNVSHYVGGNRYLQISTDGFNVQSQGIVAGSPTGGNKGVGTVNATAVYDDNVLLSDWVFEEAFGQKPGAQVAAAPEQPVKVRGPNMDRRLYSLAETKTSTVNDKRLPWMPTPEMFEEERNVGGMMTRLWVGQEQQMLYIFELESRIAALEKARSGGVR